MAKMTKTRLKPTKASKERKETDKDIKSIVMTRICQKMENAKNNLPAGKKCLPHGFIKNIVVKHQERFSDFVTRHSITSAFNRFQKKNKALAKAQESEINKTLTTTNSGTEVKLVGKTGRPSGSTIAYMLKRKDDITAMKLEITTTLKKCRMKIEKKGLKRRHMVKLAQLLLVLKRSTILKMWR